jgi:hypothetical protein
VCHIAQKIKDRSGRLIPELEPWWATENPLEEKTADGGGVTGRWQPKSQAFMEIDTMKGLYADAGQQRVKNFAFCS